ncbi:major vault protein-like isoform X1 [Limulus polyphemus]|uniref:Major vault protein n=1 Tax=Limulus polyphemus TaxID=6850 RepID=A0ABM1B4P5_LIMPO|nr:major vault protein-like isoform X1 [Limulus polyphemus]XP_022241922.1 major vault protein-like isoform X1 [Limulus polyphemus]
MEQFPLSYAKMAGTKQDLKCQSDDDSIYHIPPYYYLHVLDQTTNVTRVEVGPQNYIRKNNERIIFGPGRMVIVPPRHYCVIQNPVVHDVDNSIQYDAAGQVKLQHADLEIRLEQEPFPLYPGESLHVDITLLKVVPSNTALRLRALRDFEDGDDKKVAGDEWLFEGPGTYIPRKEVEVVETVKAFVIKPNQALKLRARIETRDRDGKIRVCGEEWLVRKTGAYLPGAYEEIVDIVNAYVLTEKEAVQVRATCTFCDDLGVRRKNGEEWLIKMVDTETYIPGVYEQVVGVVPITTLSKRQYCIILDPVSEDGKPQLGRKKLVKGEISFFLMPGERLENGIQDIYVLGENEGLILRAKESFTDDTVLPAVKRKPGDKWMIRGPVEYIPPVEVEVVTKRYTIPLDENEGIYVRDIKTGRVRLVCGEAYMLNQDEELWNKELPTVVEELLSGYRDPLADRGDWNKQASAAAITRSATEARDKTKVVTLRVPHNAAVQVYDYKEKKARVIFGPDLVMLGPDEQFTQLSLSGGKPKRPNVICSLCLLLGPDFCTDIVFVETADHARLQLQLAYNWHFETFNKSQETAASLFSVPDFVGDLCKAIASRIRGTVASVTFDDFHKNSAKIIRTAVFGYDENLKMRNQFGFPQNNLMITSVDIQSVEPVDQRTRDSLQKSVQLAIEITTQSLEATARHEAERREQEAKGRLERQKIMDEVEAEHARKELLELQASSMVVESCGQAKADAQSRVESQLIEGKSGVEKAKLKAEALRIEAETELERLTRARQAEIQYLQEQNNLEVKKAEKLADIDIQKFKNVVGSLGQETIRSIAQAGPELEVKLLQGLGIQSALITDGVTPLNLFSTAKGLIGVKSPQHKEEE